MGGQEGASAVNDTGPGGTAPGVDLESLKAFAASSASSGVNLAVLQPGAGGTTNSQGQDNGYAAALAAFNAWQATQKTGAAQRSTYLNDVLSIGQGQDATKLVGPNGAPTLLSVANPNAPTTPTLLSGGGGNTGTFKR